MSAREVTWRQYDAVMNESRTPAKQDEFPADVCWRDAREFCNDLSTTLRATVRLPTEAEWEFARREGRRIEKYYPPGNEGALNRVGWFEGNSKGSTHPVGQKAPNAFGLYDMQGNVWEFVEDDWHPTFDEAPSDGSAWVDRPRADQRVIKGGSFDFPAWHCRPTSRLYMGIGYCDGRTGFRVVLEAGHSP